jgi:hypothetical protein
MQFAIPARAGIQDGLCARFRAPGMTSEKTPVSHSTHDASSSGFLRIVGKAVSERNKQ